MKTLKTLVITLLVAGFMPFSTSAQTYTTGLNNDLGGYVFYVTPDGKHGLVAATKDQGLNKWAVAKNLVSHPDYHNDTGKKFTDWRLPTQFELKVMYELRNEIGGFKNSDYWSSILVSYSSAVQDIREKVTAKGFHDGKFREITSTSKRYIRAVRSF